MSRRTPTYSSWQSMMERCNNPKGWGFAEYGAKGVTVCERWRDFRNFLYDMGERPSGKTIDRIDGSKGYEPGNCRWATRAQQNANRRKYVIAQKAKVRGPGRPRLENGETERYELRLSKERLERYTAAAGRAGKVLAAWIKGVLDRASRR